MKIAKWIYVGGLALFFMMGTIQCAGPQSRVKKEDPREGSSKEATKITQDVLKEGPREVTKVSPLDASRSPIVPQGEPGRQMAERTSEPSETVPTTGKTTTSPRPIAQPMVSPPSPPGPAVSPMQAPQPPIKPPESSRGQRFVLNFDNADIYEVIRVMAEMMNINYIIDPRVKGVVNIRTTGQISTPDIFPIFQAILKMNGATAVIKGNIYEIVPFGEAKKFDGRPITDHEGRKIPDDEKYAIHIISLKYIPAAEVSKMIKPFLSDGADIVEHPHHNILIIGDMASNIQKSLGIIDLFDVDIFADMRVRIYPINNADVNDVAKEMERIFGSFEVSLKSGRGVGITFTPINRINSLLVVSSIPGIFDKVEKWVKDLDRIPGEGTQISVFVYYVQNGKAKDLAEVLKQVYAPAKAVRPEAKERPATPTPTPGPRGVRPTPATPGAPTPAVREEAGGVPEGEINIVVDETTNSLIIRAYQRDYKAILETIKKLDLYPKQVLIEVFLCEVTLDDSTKYGLEFSTFTDSFTKGGYTYNYTLGMGGTPPATSFTSGLRYAITSVDRLAAAIHASATEDRLKVISSPHILASNNKEAKFQIGRSEPILTNTYTTTGTTSPGVVEGTIEYKEIGILLNVTPRISDSKLVTMDISVEQSTVGKTSLGNLPEVPFFPKKTAKTTLSILEGQTIVIGGLMEDKKETIKTGVPFLSKIPILGALFGYHTNALTKTETLLFLTPHVISDMAESNRVTQEFREKVFSIQKELQRLKEEKEKEKQKEGERSKVEPSDPRIGISQARATESISP
jgi:general secretion pathway protein D